MTQPSMSSEVVVQVGKAWQRSIRESLDEEPSLFTEIPSLRTAIVRPTTLAIAKRIILKYEWLGTLPGTCKRFYGIFFDDVYCAGVACFSGIEGLAGGYIATAFGLEGSDMTYLARGACVHWSPKGTASKLISNALRMEARRGYKVAIAYADTDAGEVGTVYQATNWLCLGKGKGGYCYFRNPLTGKKVNSRVTEAMRRRSGRKGSMTNPEVERWLMKRGWIKEEANTKYRYVYVLSTGKDRQRMLNRLSKLVKPYPKRAPVEGSSDQEEIGGSTPTRTLQKGKNA